MYQNFTKLFTKETIQRLYKSIGNSTELYNILQDFTKLYKPLHNSDIRWNFEKFLIDRRGRPVMRFDPSTRGSVLEEHIIRLLKEEVPKPETDFVQVHF